MGIFLALAMYIYILVIYVICAAPGLIIAGIIIFLIRKIVNKKGKTFKTIMYTIIIAFCAYTSMGIVFPALSYEREEPDELYVEMKGFNDNKNLIGLSEDVIIELFGEQRNEYNTEDGGKILEYSAGTIIKRTFFGYTTDYYEFEVYFDENDKVKSTSIRFVP